MSSLIGWHTAGQSIPKEDILKVPCDVLIPAAIGGVIDEDNAGDLQCKVRAAGRAMLVCVNTALSSRAQ